MMDRVDKYNCLIYQILKAVEKNSFSKYMKKEGKLGGQNKVPKLSNESITVIILLTLSAGVKDSKP